MNDFDKWEAEEAVRRQAQYEKNKEAVKQKSKQETAKQEAGIGVEDGTEEFEEDEEDEE